MIPLIHASFLSHKNSISTLKEESSIQSSKYISVVQTINSFKELEDKSLKEQLKRTFKENKKLLHSSFSSTPLLEIINVVSIQIKEFEFKDKHISIINTLKQEVDILICNSYSNTMLIQLISKKSCHIVCNVFSQDLVNRFDFIHHFNSGINHVLSNEMGEKEMMLGVELSIFQNVSEFKQAKYFSSCIQNSKLATKSKIPHLLFKIIYSKTDFRTQRELVLIQKALFHAQPLQIQHQLTYLEQFLETRLKIKRGELIK
ncbi:MAG: hypothetical protein ACMXYB_03745 [Candidatus Woesearchaeota archaeon]